MKKLTPMMMQYQEIKNEYKDYILFFRLGDFYEMFFDDAITASKVLDITLTGRNCGLEEKAPLCGVPYHSAEGYIKKLVDNNFKVAICEQVEDPKEAKGIVKREVTRIVTPGLLTDPSMMDENNNNYILSIYMEDDIYAIAFSDISTAEFKTTYFTDYSSFMNEVQKIDPKEVLISEDTEFDNYLVTKLSKAFFNKDFAVKALKRGFNVFSVDALGLINDPSIIASGVLINYIEDTQKVSLKHFNKIENYNYNDYMIIDKFTRRNLELIETMRTKEKKGSLLGVLDKTLTSMGARMLKSWVLKPLINEEMINERLDIVEFFYKNALIRNELKEFLKPIYDLERIASKMVYGSVNARDLISLKTSLYYLPDIYSLLQTSNSESIQKLISDFDNLEDIYALIDQSIIEEPAFSIREGNIIKEEYNKDLYELRDLIHNSKSWIINLEKEQKELTGINTLKIGFNKVFGYYIEVSKKQSVNVPDSYIRKQTLANAERYIYPELKEMEVKLLNAEERINKLEYELFIEIKDQILDEIIRIKHMAKIIATLDSLLSMAVSAYENNYIRPRILNTGDIIIKEGRHPVVESISEDLFVPNDTVLNNTSDRFYIITGPNMAGKSTYLRQVALISLMAQIGSFVPCTSGDISIVDRIFTRVGASDDLSQGQSTFMVEMNELSNILNNATKDSLIILDEIGRGTSTYDGLSIAWSVVEYISQKHGSKTMFATHYHELTELEDIFEGVKNYCISVEESKDNIIFLRKIKRGGADKSYGIEVAKLAGLPQEVIDRANVILKELEDSDINKDKKAKEVVKYKDDEIKTYIKNLNVLNITPLEAMNILNELFERVNNEE